MPPAKSRNAHEDSKSDAKDKDKDKSHGGSSHQSNGKMRRQASQANHARGELAASSIADKAASGGQEPVTVQWNSFDRDVLHSYRREHRLDVPKCYSTSYHHYVFNQAGSIGMLSPTMARRKEQRRQTKEQLATAVRKHFNSMGVSENDVIVDLLHSVRHHGARASKSRPEDISPTEADR